MNFHLRIMLHTTPAQVQALQTLQAAFGEVCNALAPMVQATRVWNRVALHHAAYRQLRAQFPAMGSQMVCNAIYAVSRTCRQVFQHPDSPWNVALHPDKPLPLLHFAPDGPVFFDRHTLSVKNGVLSLYTLEGRMRFEQQLREGDEALFHTHKLREVVLTRQDDGSFALTLWLVDQTAATTAHAPATPSTPSAPNTPSAPDTLTQPRPAKAGAGGSLIASPQAGVPAVPLPSEQAAGPALGVFDHVAPGALPDFVQLHPLTQTS